MCQWCSSHSAVGVPELIPCFVYVFSSVCVLFAHPYLSNLCVETFWLAKPMPGSLSIPTLMPCVTQLRNHPHANVEACGNAMSELKKTRDEKLRDEKLRDSQRWCFCSTSPGLTVSENIFNYSTWRIEKPKTEQRPFNM